jgi:hypothetical protein
MVSIKARAIMISEDRFAVGESVWAAALEHERTNRLPDLVVRSVEMKLIRRWIGRV